jgi:enterobactin synthetase component D
MNPTPIPPFAGPHASASAQPRFLALRTAEGRPLPTALLAFEPDGFDADWFGAAAIACPPTIARSVRKRQAAFFFGRLAARHALAALGAVDLAVGIGQAREPLWPTGVVGSISHSGPFAAAAVAPDTQCRGIGIDIEAVIGDETRAALLAAAVDADELTILQRQPAGVDLNTWLTLVFSAKESLFKGMYPRVGRWFDFSAARLQLCDPVDRRLDFALTETLCDELARRRCCAVHYEFIAAGTVITSFAW